MKKHLNTVNSFNKAATIIALSTILGTVTYAWTGPTGTAPSNNTPAPINVGSTLQEKLGSLNVRGAFTITGGYKGYSALTTAGDDQSTLVTKSYVDGISVTETDPTVPAYVKDGTDWTEITNKPTIPSQGITSISGGNCSAGQVIKSISSDGTATCDVDVDKIKVLSAHGVTGSSCLGTYEGGFCSGLFYIDIVFQTPFTSTPNVIVVPENISSQSGCVGGATDKVQALPSGITRNGFRLYVSGSPVGANCGVYEGWSTQGTAGWIAIGN